MKYKLNAVKLANAKEKERGECWGFKASGMMVIIYFSLITEIMI